jgi:hypothetical protein
VSPNADRGDERGEIQKVRGVWATEGTVVCSFLVVLEPDSFEFDNPNATMTNSVGSKATRQPKQKGVCLIGSRAATQRGTVEKERELKRPAGIEFVGVAQQGQEARA